MFQGCAKRSYQLSIQVIPDLSNDEELWNGFIDQIDSHTFCHRTSWIKAVEKSYGLHVLRLKIMINGTLIGIMPIAVMPRFFWRKKIAISMPYAPYGGVLVLKESDRKEAEDSVISHLKKNGIKNFEFRNIAKQTIGSANVSMIFPLPGDEESLWNGLHQKKRNQVRKGIVEGFGIFWGNQFLEDFYTIYSANVGLLGTPVHSKQFFKNVLSEFEPQSLLLIIRDGAKAIGGLMLIRSGNVWVNTYAAVQPEYRAKNVSNLMYWEALKFASSTNAKFFDFGRSRKGTGNYHFKSQWGAMPIELDYQCYVNDHKAISTIDEYGSNTAKGLSKIWRMLPYRLQLILGPNLRKYLP